MIVEVHPHALAHGLTSEEIIYAWRSLVKCRQRTSKDEPPRWIGVGLLPSGKFAELVAVEQLSGAWLVFHAMTPPTKKFLLELGLKGAKDGRN